MDGGSELEGDDVEGMLSMKQRRERLLENERPRVVARAIEKDEPGDVCGLTMEQRIDLFHQNRERLERQRQKARTRRGF